VAAAVIGVDPDPSTRGGVDMRLTGFPPRITVWGGNGIGILHQFGAYTESIDIGPF
jgi:hypothetical protein